MYFWRFIKTYYFRYLVLFIIGILTLVAVDYVQTLMPDFLRRITDLFNKAIDNGGYTEIMKQEVVEIVSYVFLIGGVMFLGRIIWRVTLFNASHRIEANIRHDMFKKAERLPLGYYHDNKVGTIMGWFTTDLEAIEEFIGFGTVMMVDAIFLSIITIIKMVRFQPQLTLLISIPLVLIVIWGFIVERVVSKKWSQRQESYDKLFDFAQESFTGIRVIKAFLKENKQIHEFAKVARKNKDANISLGKTFVFFDVMIEIIISLICALLFGFGGWFVVSAISGNPIVLFNASITISGADLVAFFAYFDLLVWPLIALGQIITVFSKARTSLKRIYSFFDTKEDIYISPNPVFKSIEGNIDIKNLTFKYKTKSFYSIVDMNISIKAGERIGIVGKIGTGKSTLANILLRLYDVEPNTIFIDGVDILEYDITSLRNQISIVPQESFLFSDTIRKNISFSDKTLSEDKIIEAAKFANVHEDILDFEKQYDTISGERGVTLSGGQKQRISIARAFIKDSPILILDDSVSAVDVKTEENILNNIKEYRNHKTTIVIASRVSTVAHFDKILVLKNGLVEAFDSFENLMKTSPSFRKMVELQELEKEVEGI